MLNRLAPDEHPVEVVVLSRYHADDGVRVMDAVAKYGLDISRAFFMAGRKPYPFMDAVNASLYLSTNAEQVREAVSLGYPAGHVLPCAATDDASDDLLPATAQGFIVWQSDLDDGHSAICIATPHQD